MKKTLTKLTLGCLMLLTITLWQACKKDEVITSQIEPKMTTYYPNSGKGGTLITIEGEGLNTDINAYEASVSDVRADVVSATKTALVIRVPDQVQSGNIKIKIDDKNYEVGAFTYQDLTISSIFPTNGPAGAQIRITGAGFGSTKEPAKVTVNGKEALVVSVTDVLMVAEIPAQAGTGPVVVRVDDKETTGQHYKYQEIEGIKPMTGGKNTRVTIHGVGFETLKTGNIVDFNGKLATVIEATEEKLVVQAPDGVTTGPLSVTINDQKITGPSFSVVPFPVIKTVTPLSAPVGSEVVITGENYSTLSDEVIVTINGVTAPVTKTDAKSITIKVPENAGQGLVLVNVNDQITAGPEFKEQNLGITKVFPDNGMEGDEITISGLGFSSQPSENRVLFNNMMATVVSATASELKVIVPDHVSTGALTIETNGIHAKWPEFKRAGVTTLAGGPGTSDFANLQSIAVDSKGNVFVATSYNMIKKITPAGVVTVFAGSTESGAVDNVGDKARFNSISGIAVGENDNLYVAESFNRRIRKVTPEGTVSTVTTLSFGPVSLATDKQGNVYIGQSYSGAHLLNKVTGGLTKITGMYESPDYMSPLSLTEMYYAPAYTDYLRVFSVVNNVKGTHAGSGQWGLDDGAAMSATFRGIIGLAMSKEKVLYVMDGFAVLRKVEEGVVTSIIGLDASGQVKSGYENGSFVKARFSDVKNICIDNDGNVYVADNGNKAVRKVTFR